jgi:hypothetical protein
MLPCLCTVQWRYLQRAWQDLHHVSLYERSQSIVRSSIASAGPLLSLMKYLRCKAAVFCTHTSLILLYFGAYYCLYTVQR